MLRNSDIRNFNTIKMATLANQICLMDVQRRSDGKKMAAICAVNIEENGDRSFVPLALMVEGNPYEMFNPPLVGSRTGYAPVAEQATPKE